MVKGDHFEDVQNTVQKLLEAGFNIVRARGEGNLSKTKIVASAVITFAPRSGYPWDLVVETDKLVGWFADRGVDLLAEEKPGGAFISAEYVPPASPEIYLFSVTDALMGWT